ncbi:MAG TPA: S9 family peptidase, partial [Pseudonocardiaceae bacterium]|nr:S9 family peptidase [Pseudonocardiaceae bacterium]
MRPEDIELTNLLTSPTLHGDLLVAAVAHPDLQRNHSRGGLVQVPLDGGEPVYWTRGARDAAPALSPDGRWLAFVRTVAVDDGSPRAQLHVMPTSGGEPVRLTSLPIGVGKPVWAPDSSRIAFSARVPEPGRYGTVDDEWGDTATPDAEAPRVITRMDYQIDNIGYLVDRRSRLFVVDAGPILGGGTEAPEPLELTDGRCDAGDPAWTPDGAYLVFSAPHDLGVKETLLDDVYAVPATGGDVFLVAATGGGAEELVVTDDGVVIYVGSVPGDHGFVANNHGLWATLFRPGEPSTPSRLTDLETVDCDAMGGTPVVVGGDVLVCVRNRGAVELRRVPLDAAGATLEQLPVVVGQRAAVRGFTARDDKVVAVVSTADAPTELVLRTGGETKTLTDFSTRLRGAGLRPMVEINTTAPDGYPVHGWVVLPDGPGPHPVLLFVHG